MISPGIGFLAADQPWSFCVLKRYLQLKIGLCDYLTEIQVPSVFHDPLFTYMCWATNVLRGSADGDHSDVKYHGSCGQLIHSG